MSSSILIFDKLNNEYITHELLILNSELLRNIPCNKTNDARSIVFRKKWKKRQWMTKQLYAYRLQQDATRANPGCTTPYQNPSLLLAASHRCTLSERATNCLRCVKPSLFEAYSRRRLRY